MTKRPHFAGYRRVSTRKQIDGFSLDEQYDMLDKLANSHGGTWEDFCDPGISGEELEERPQMMALLSRLDEFEAVMIVDASRLARDDYVAAFIRRQLRDANVRVFTPSGETDLADPVGNLQSGILGLFSHYEQQIRTQKMKAGLRRTAEAGFWPGGPPPYGYQVIPDPNGSKHKKLAINEKQRDLLRLVYDLIVDQGHSTLSGAKYLNAHGYRTVTGCLWRHPNLCFRLRQRHLAGHWVYKQGDDPITVDIPPVFSEAEWSRLQASIKGRPRTQRKTRLYPLTGRGRVHLRCDCGGNFFGKTDSSKKSRSYYECSRNHHAFGDDRCAHRPRIIRAPLLEQSVWDEVEAIIADEDYLLELASSYLASLGDERGPEDTRGLRNRLTQLRQQKTRIVRQLADSDELEALSDALAEVNDEEQILVDQIKAMDQRKAARVEKTTIEEQLKRLARTVRTRLSAPTPGLMAEIFDLLQLDLVRVGPERFEGTGSIPLPEDGGDVWEKGPLRLSLRRRRSGRASLRVPPLTLRTI